MVWKANKCGMKSCVNQVKMCAWLKFRRLKCVGFFVLEVTGFFCIFWVVLVIYLYIFCVKDSKTGQKKLFFSHLVSILSVQCVVERTLGCSAIGLVEYVSISFITLKFTSNFWLSAPDLLFIIPPTCGTSHPSNRVDTSWRPTHRCRQWMHVHLCLNHIECLHRRICSVSECIWFSFTEPLQAWGWWCHLHHADSCGHADMKIIIWALQDVVLFSF